MNSKKSNICLFLYFIFSRLFLFQNIFKNNANNFYYFEIAANGQYVYGKCLNDKWIDIIPWTECSLINQGDNTNHLTVRREAQKIDFLINNQMVNSATFEKLPGDRFGFTVAKRQTVEFDNLIVRAN